MPDTTQNRPPLADANDLARLAAESQANAIETRVRDLTEKAASAGAQAETIAHALSRHMDRIARTHSDRAATLARSLGDAAAGVARLPAEDMRAAAAVYAADFMQRWVLTLDAFRKRGDVFLEHERDECPPVLVYEHEVIADGRDFDRPCNYRLLRIVPPEGMPSIDRKRPYVIIDPRAGHGAGIGGFKLDSQVGVALRKGHPVYFMAFTPNPAPTQTIADVTHAEAEFVRIVMTRHPESNKPIIIGNCQGGWATALLAATNPDITGPVVFNGAPMAYWSGRVGENPMRYNGGLMGGVLPAMVLADLAGGKFDGAHLVQNFEFLNPSRNFFSQYYELFRSIDDSEQRFLEFQKWWGGYFWMTEAEIRWIVENLFIGNKLARGEAELEPGRFVNVKNIRAPIIVFASHGDNITPPQQALNWIVDSYASVEEIRLSGQRIVYMVHEKVGHLGIFVSSSVAKREHSEMASTMKTIEALAPGLYEMVIEDVVGEGHDAHFYVSFHSRKLSDIDALDDGRDDEKPLAAVARASDLTAEVYDVCARPFVKAASAPIATEIARAFHPLRAQRWAMASWNPWMRSVARAADSARAVRTRADAANLFVAMEALWAEGVAQSLDLARDLRDMAYEAAFYALWANPAAIAFGAARGLPRAKKTPRELRLMPQVQSALLHVESGGFVEAVIRMLIMLAEARGSVRRDRLERSAKVLAHDRPFCEIAPALRGQIIHEQSIIAQFEPEAAVEALAKMIPVPESRVEAMAVIEYIIGPLEEMEPHTIARLQRFREVLELEAISVPEALRVKMMTEEALHVAERAEKAAREAAE